MRNQKASGGRARASAVAAALVGTLFSSSAVAATKLAGGDTLELTSPTPYPTYGDFTIATGTLRLNFANLAPPTNLLSASTALTMGDDLFVAGGGSTLSVICKPDVTAITSQSFASLSLQAGQSHVVVDPAGGGGT